MYLKLYLQIFVTFIITISCSSSETKRVIKCAVYSQLSDIDNKDSLNIVHIIATGEQDVIHYLWSTYDNPSVIVSRTTNDTTLKIDFVKLRLFQEGAITFSKEPLASTGFTITELWKILYDKDTDEVSDISSIEPLNLELFQWNNVTNNSISCSDQFALLNFIASSGDDVFLKQGTFEVQFSVSGKEDSASDYPHLIYTGNSTQLKITFNKFYSNSSRVRYGMEMYVFAPLSKKCINNDCRIVTTKSVSDEFSPGIFSDIELLPPCSHDSFLSWRPVAYISRRPTVANSSDVKMISKCSNAVTTNYKSIAELYYKAQLNFSASAFNITFGTKGDGFYHKTDYVEWSLMAGVGSSVGFKLSAAAIIIATVGMGALLLFILSGLIFIGVQKCRRRNDDELLLVTNNIN